MTRSLHDDEYVFCVPKSLLREAEIIVFHKSALFRNLVDRLWIIIDTEGLRKEV